MSLERLEQERYISIQTTRRDGSVVNTPVWFVIKEQTIYVLTFEKTGKVRRIKNNRGVMVAPCTISGKVTSSWIQADAEILHGHADRIMRLRDAKYGILSKILKLFIKRSKLVVIAVKIRQSSA